MFVGGHVGDRIPESGLRVKKSLNMPLLTSESLLGSNNFSMATSTNSAVDSLISILAAANKSQATSKDSLIILSGNIVTSANFSAETSISSPFTAPVDLLATMNIARGKLGGPITSGVSLLQGQNFASSISASGVADSSIAILSSGNYSSVVSQDGIILATLTPQTPDNLGSIISENERIKAYISLPVTAGTGLVVSTSSPVEALSSILDSSTVGQQQLFEYLQSLQPGETLEVDANELTVKLDGSNIREQFYGDYPFLSPGMKVITYSDGETSRTIEIEIIKKDRTI